MPWWIFWKILKTTKGKTKSHSWSHSPGSTAANMLGMFSTLFSEQVNRLVENLGKALSLCEPPIPHLKNETRNTHFVRPV